MKKRLWGTMAAVAMSATMLLSATLAFAETEQTTEDGIAVTAKADENGFVIENGVLTGYEGTAAEVVIPDGVTEIGRLAFARCFHLTKVTIPNGVTSIGNSAFSNCTALTEISIPDSLTSIGDTAFANCTALTEISIPGSLISIGGRVFFSCSSLTSINVAPENNTYASVDGCVYSKDKTTLLICPGGKTTVNFPASVTSIGDRAFVTCTALKELSIPDSVTSIGNSVFYYSWLEKVIIPESVTSIGDLAFNECSATIYGKAGSYAETYAKEHNLPFSVISTEDVAIDTGETNTTYTKGSSEGATIKCSGDLADFLNVYVDGTLIDTTNYTLKEGSTLITFTQAFMDTLSAGEHIFTLEYTEGRKVEVTMKITGGEGQPSTTGTTGNSQQQADASKAKTGDNADMVLWMILALASAGCALVTRRKLVKIC